MKDDPVTIELLNEKRQDGSELHMSAALRPGSLTLEIHDLGFVAMLVSPAGEYEASTVIPESEFPALLKLLGAREGEDLPAVLKRAWTGEKSKDLGALLRDSGVRHEVFPYPH